MGSGLSYSTNNTTMKGIYKFSEDYCYGYIEGVFAADSEDIEILESAHTCVQFGEVLGKYSDVEVTFKPGTCELVSDDPVEVAILEKVTDIGYNPFGYEDFSFENSDELNDIHKKQTSECKWLWLEDFIHSVRTDGTLNTIKTEDQ